MGILIEWRGELFVSRESNGGKKRKRKKICDPSTEWFASYGRMFWKLEWMRFLQTQPRINGDCEMGVGGTERIQVKQYDWFEKCQVDCLNEI